MPTPREAVATARLLSFISPTAAEIRFLGAIPGEDCQVRAGETICPNHRGEGFFLLLEGWAANSIISEEGDERINSINLPGDMLGTASFVMTSPVDRTYALTDLTLRWVPGSVMRDMFLNHPRLAATMMLVAQEERALKNEWISLHSSSASKRFAGFLFRIGERLARLRELTGEGLEIPLKQRQVAEAIGVTPVYVHQLIRRFREQALIEPQRGCIHILDLHGLQEAAGLPTWKVTAPGWLPEPETV